MNTTGVRITDISPMGYSIYGLITINEIRFKSHLRFGYPEKLHKGYKYCLEIYSGKKNWNDKEEQATMGWDYFGTSKWHVSAFKLCPEDNNVAMFLPYGLRHSEDSYTDRIRDIILQQAPQSVPAKSLPSVSDDFPNIKRDDNNTVVFLPEVHVEAYSEEEPIPSAIEKKKKCVSCTKKQPLSFYASPSRSCKSCMANMTTKRVLRFPSRAVSIHK